MSAEDQAGAFVASYADQQLGIIGVRDVSGENGVIRGFLAQLVRLAGEPPHERIEPEECRRNSGKQQLHPVHSGDVRQLMGDDCLGFV